MDCALYARGAFVQGAHGAIAMLHCAAPGEPWWRTALSIATLVVVMLSALVAWRSLENNRAIARKKATIDLIEKVESTDHYRALERAFNQVRTSGAFTALNAPRTAAETILRKQMLDYMGHYELVAIGIRRGVLDETIYKSWMQSHVVLEWNTAADFIQNERWRLNADGSDLEYRAELFEHFQWAACRWSRDARRLTATSSPKPVVPTGPVAAGDVALPEVERAGR